MEEPTPAFRSHMNMVVTPVSCISLHERDKIRVMNLPEDAITLLRTVIQSSWSRGIQSERTYSASYEFKLNGNPWTGNSEEANTSRCLVARILRTMLQLGWGLLVNTDITKHETDKDTMYFKRRAPEPNVLMAAVSFNKSDTVRLLEGNSELAEVVRATIQNCWHRGLQDEGSYYGAPDFKMHGNPWAAAGTDTVYARVFLANLIQALDAAGWEVYTSIGVVSGIHNLDTWVLKSKARV